ncbi:MAG: 30S ribosomal protein S4 [Cystobacterineae bacterium]|nr:30S ribosomal protein S4 [Cystobacterineae bacterium]
MARYIGSVCRICRRENLKMYLKGDRCYTDKCAIARRAYPPGQHGQGRMKFSNYGVQLREKQKVKRMYGLLEKQFRGYYHRAEAAKGKTGELLLQLLELRLDNVVYRLGFADTRSEARQLVRHGHFWVNGKRVDIPSYAVKVGSVVEVGQKAKEMVRIQEAVETVDRRGIPQWLEMDKTALKGTVKAHPNREDLTMPIQEQLIVELYSK